MELPSSSEKSIPTFNVTFSSTSSYAEIANNTPKRDQGLILDCVEGLELTDYACAVGNIVLPKNVLSASRISNNRVCIHLASKELVNQLTEQNDFIKIKDLKITIRPLQSRHKRVIFSNVPTDLPNCALEKVLEQLNIKKCSNITTLRATINNPDYSHVSSFRRQVYVKPDDAKKIPDLFKVNFNELIYFIFAGSEVMRCFHCKLEGHQAKNCPNSETNSQNLAEQTITKQTLQLPESINVPQLSINKTSIANSSIISAIDSDNRNFIAPTVIPDAKRSRSEASLSTSEKLSNIPTSDKVKNTRSKKQKINEQFTDEESNQESSDNDSRKKTDNIKTILVSAKDYFDANKDTLPMNLDQLELFLVKTYYSTHVVEEAEKISTDISAIIDMLLNVRRSIADNKLQSRLFRIINKLKNKLKSAQNKNTEHETKNADMSNDESI